jgi:hypothetical protein
MSTAAECQNQIIGKKATVEKTAIFKTGTPATAAGTQVTTRTLASLATAAETIGISPMSTAEGRPTRDATAGMPEIINSQQMHQQGHQQHSIDTNISWVFSEILEKGTRMAKKL